MSRERRLKNVNQREELLYEARIIIIGEANAGKTTLRHKLKSVANPLAKASTLGIDVDVDKGNVFTCTILDGKTIKFHYQIWECSGQRPYHFTHPLFFSQNTLYILVTNTDRNSNEDDVEFLLETIHKLSDGSPVIRLENAPTNRDDEMDWSGINNRFGSMIKGVFKVNLNRIDPTDVEIFNLDDANEFHRFSKQIYTQLELLGHIGSKVPSALKKIRKEISLETANKATISFDEFKKICKKFGYSEEENIRSLSGTLHNLGIILHYQNNPVLKNFIIIQNEWAINSILTLLDSKMLSETNGRFYRNDLDNIWNEGNYRGWSDELLALLLHFGLCYLIPGSNSRYLVPQKLSSFPPKQFVWDENDNARVVIKYNSLPRELITLLIVDMHEFIAKDKNWVWQKGLVISGNSRRWANTMVYIQEEYRAKTLSVKLKGKFSEDIFNEVQSKLHSIHQNYEGIIVNYIIYCPCSDCKQSDNPTTFDYQKELLHYRRNLNLEKIECRRKAQKVKIGDVLKGIISEEQAKNDVKDNSVTVNVHVKNEIDMSKTPINPEKANTGLYGALTAFIIILPTIGLTFNHLQVGAAVTVCVVTLLTLMLMLVYAGAHSGAFKEDTFVKISEGILRKIPGLSSLVNLIKGD